MICGFRSRALKRFWTKDDASGIRPDWLRRIRMILDALDVAAEPESLDLPGLGFHSLVGDRRGQFAVTVSRNWRITFGWSEHGPTDINLEDYHG